MCQAQPGAVLFVLFCKHSGCQTLSANQYLIVWMFVGLVDTKFGSYFDLLHMRTYEQFMSWHNVDISDHERILVTNSLWINLCSDIFMSSSRTRAGKSTAKLDQAHRAGVFTLRTTPRSYCWGTLHYVAARFARYLGCLSATHAPYTDILALECVRYLLCLSATLYAPYTDTLALDFGRYLGRLSATHVPYTDMLAVECVRYLGCLSATLHAPYTDILALEWIPYPPNFHE